MWVEACLRRVKINFLSKSKEECIILFCNIYSRSCSKKKNIMLFLGNFLYSYETSLWNSFYYKIHLCRNYSWEFKLTQREFFPYFLGFFTRNYFFFNADIVVSYIRYFMLLIHILGPYLGKDSDKSQIYIIIIIWIEICRFIWRFF